MGTQLVRFIVVHACLGGAAGVAFVGLMMWLNVGNLRTLVMASDVGVVALGVMTMFFVITFGSVQVGVALMMPAQRHDGDGKSRRWFTAPPALNPVPVRPRSR